MTLAERLQQQLTFGKALGLGLFFAGLYYSIGYNSGSSLKLSIEKAKEQIQDSETEIKTLENQISRIATMKKVMEVLGEEFESFLAYIPEKLSLPELMRMISTEARAAGVSVNGIGELQQVAAQTKRPGADHPFYEEMGVEVELQGTYSQILLFLSYLTKLDKILTISQLSMVSQAKVGDRESPIITFRCQIKGYRYVKNEPTASTEPAKQ